MSDFNGSLRPALDARLEGSAIFNCPANTVKTFYVPFDFDCELSGIEIYAWSSNVGDNVSMETQYQINENTWKRYKKFGKGWNVFPDRPCRIILFPTTPKEGIRMAITYNNKGQSAVNFCINKFQFVDEAKVDPTQGQEGEVW